MATPKPYSEQEAAPAKQPNKVAETVSPYIIRSETERATLHRKPEPRYIAGLPASDEVWRFAQENALVPHLETAIRLVRDSFKSIKLIQLAYEIDPEILGRASIAIDLHVSGSMDELQNAYTNYVRAFINAISDEHRGKINLLLWID
jgi:hypothetical protein